MWIIASLIFLGLVCLLVETLLTPGVGIAGILGLASMAVAGWYAFTYHGSRVGWIVVLIVLVLVAAALVFALRAKTWRRFELDTEIRSRVNRENEVLRAGMEGVSLTRLAPMGTVRFDSVECEAKSFDNHMIAAGTPVEICRIEDNKVIVKPSNA